MSVSKKPCKNHPSYTFSGKESSPLGLGYTAEAEQVGTVMEGRDKTMWMVGIKNAVKVWNRIPTQVAASVVKPMEKDTPVMKTDDDAGPSTPPTEPKKDEKEEVSPPKEEKKRAPKKAAPKKKAEEATETSSETSEKKKKAPTAFNIYMSYRVAKLGEEHPEMNHKAKFSQAAADWKAMDADAKAKEAEIAREWKAAKN
jgi:hypothetical protein